MNNIRQRQMIASGESALAGLAAHQTVALAQDAHAEGETRQQHRGELIKAARMKAFRQPLEVAEIPVPIQ